MLAKWSDIEASVLSSDEDEETNKEDRQEQRPSDYVG